MCKYIVSGNVDKIYFMSTFPETISYYLKKSFVLYIYIYIYEEFGYKML